MSAKVSAPMDIARIEPMPFKRAISLFIVFVLGLILVYIAFTQPPQSMLLRVLLFGLGIVFLWLAERMRRATQVSLVLFEDRLEDSNGQLICHMQDVVAVERGPFAFKPSNGFLIRTRDSGAAKWEPGLWWRRGRKIGIGGVTPAGPAKYMAELIAAKSGGSAAS